MVSLVSSLSGTTADYQMVRDFTATSLIGPQATAAENVNAQFASCLYHCWYNLTFVEGEFPGKVWEILKPAVNVSNHRSRIYSFARTFTFATSPVSFGLSRVPMRYTRQTGCRWHDAQHAPWDRRAMEEPYHEDSSADDSHSTLHHFVSLHHSMPRSSGSSRQLSVVYTKSISADLLIQCR
jgi:hypothetical protein